MNKVKIIYKIQTIILLAVMLCLIVCLTIGGTASADTAQYAAEDEYDYMTFDILFAAVARNGLQKMIPIGAVQLHLGIHYVPSTDANYDYYVIRSEIIVAAETFSTLKRFTMTPARWNNSGFQIVSEKNNQGNALIPDGTTYATGITGIDGLDYTSSDLNITWNNYGEVFFEYVSLNYNEEIKSRYGAPGYEMVIRKQDEGKLYMNDEFLKNYLSQPMIVRRDGRSNSAWSSDLKNDRGKCYTSLYYATYRVNKNIRERHFGFVFNELEMWGQAGQPSFSLNSDKDKLTILTSWENGFSNRAINATMSPASGGQYFVKVFAGSSLKTIENTETSFNFAEY